jgi:hypothetical protein
VSTLAGNAASKLTLLQAWRAPGTAGHDWDFGSSPTLFGGTGTPPDVGACNKNGIYYGLTANPLGSSPLWQDTIGAAAGPAGSCLASAVWDGSAGTMYIGGDGTTIGTTSHGGSVRQVNPATGAYVWQAGLPCAVMGTPSLDSAGVLAAATDYCPTGANPAAYLINASTGAILKTLRPARVASSVSPSSPRAPCSSRQNQTACTTSRPKLSSVGLGRPGHV